MLFLVEYEAVRSASGGTMTDDPIAEPVREHVHCEYPLWTPSAGAKRLWIIGSEVESITRDGADPNPVSQSWYRFKVG